MILKCEHIKFKLQSSTFKRVETVLYLFIRIPLKSCIKVWTRQDRALTFGVESQWGGGEENDERLATDQGEHQPAKTLGEQDLLHPCRDTFTVIKIMYERVHKTITDKSQTIIF